MIKFSHYEIEKDIHMKGKAIYYLIGIDEGTTKGYVIASYSIKMNRIIVKNKDNYMADWNILDDFVKKSIERYNNENRD